MTSRPKSPGPDGAWCVGVAINTPSWTKKKSICLCMCTFPLHPLYFACQMDNISHLYSRLYQHKVTLHNHEMPPAALKALGHEIRHFSKLISPIFRSLSSSLTLLLRHWHFLKWADLWVKISSRIKAIDVFVLFIKYHCSKWKVWVKSKIANSKVF